MKGTKHTMTIEINVLSTGSIPGLLIALSKSMQDEVVSGEITMEDGDSMVWDTSREEVIF